MQRESERKGRIVVGVDGSPPSIRALEWALDEAELVDATVTALSVLDFSADWGIKVSLDADEHLTEKARKDLDRVVGEVTTGRTSVRVDRKVVPGHAAEQLLAEAVHADLLVVGNRGHGGFAGSLLGSVGQYCVQHAKCPVVVVRPKD